MAELEQKLKPLLIRKGRNIKRIKKRTTIQNVLTEKFLILSISLVSKYSLIIEKTVRMQKEHQKSYYFLKYWKL